MENTRLLNLLACNPVIAAVKDDGGLNDALKSDVAVIFLLYGNILTLSELVERIHAAGKAAFVHMDLAEGLAPREISVDFLAQSARPDGIISTKASLTKRGREIGMISIQRFFLLDSMALKNIERQDVQNTSDLIEVLPGLMPKLIRQVGSITGKPVIAGGLISNKEEVTGALSAGALAVSTTSPEVWSM